MGGGQDEDQARPSSSSSSTDSNLHNNGSYHRRYETDSRSVASCSSSSCLSSNTRNGNYCYNSKDLSTDLRLGLSISSLSSPQDLSSSPRGQYSDWPPIKPLLRNTLAGRSSNNNRLIIDNDSLFVKVYMEGVPIGRKLNLLHHDGYYSLISTLAHMFNTTILFPGTICPAISEDTHILTYEDKEGDWMMVGDVPWELFLTTVSRLKIAALDRS